MDIWSSEAKEAECKALGGASGEIAASDGAA